MGSKEFQKDVSNDISDLNEILLKLEEVTTEVSKEESGPIVGGLLKQMNNLDNSMDSYLSKIGNFTSKLDEILLEQEEINRKNKETEITK